MKGHPYTILFCFILATVFINSKGCEIEGVDNWLIAVSRSINDTFRGDILDLSTTNIDAINSITYAEGLNSGPYLDISYTNSRFVISTNAAFESYEEVETSGLIAVTVNFRCTDGIPAFRPFVFRINVVDTNNNAPQFIPSDQFVFTLAPPLPPGFLITGCFNDITVRDIDLTTQRIEFKIEENPYFEIAYDETAQTSDKEFKAILRTTTFIRSIPNSLTYRITATDVDLTSDPPLSTTATVTIDGNSDFEFPEELVFTQAYYLANYTEDDRLVLTESIALVQGYHDSVNFTLHGEYNSSFELIKDGNQLSLQVVTSLQAESLTEQQILLVIRADREYTSGSTATIIVQFPERIDLEFERIHYEGQIEDNSFRLPLLVLTKGYENRSVSAVILGDHSSYFSAVVQDNTIDITTTGLTEEVIEENSFIHLEIAASNDYSTAFAIVTLEIIKNDSVTPVFNKPVYEGAYSPNFSLDLEQIVIVQGYDDSVSISVEGDYARFFQVIQTGTTINLTASDIPPEIFSEQHIILSVEATKPRTVGANAAVIISLPAARQLDFEKTTYKGTLQDNVLNLEEIVLEIGYEDSVDFFLFGSYATYFSVSNDRNVVSINLIAPIPANVILENNNIVLTLSASGANAVTATTSVILDIIKDDITTPVFARSIYVGSYASSLVIENINLIQGFDDSVTFRLDGDHSEYFQISDSAGSVVLSLRSAIPENIMFEQKVLLFNILAEKPLTVGANAAILIKFPPELTESTVLSFTQNTYTGTLENNTLNTDIITLNGQYDSSTEFVLNGEYSSYFALANTENVITISPVTPLPNEVITLNAFLILEIEANRERAVTGRTSVVIEIINQETISPKFAEAYYRGVYGPAGLEFDDEITLLVGYDETVQFILLGDFANYFLLTQEDNSLNLTNISPLPETVLENNRHLIFSVEAQKPNTLSDHTAIFLDIDTGINYAVVLRFEQPSYLGSLQNNELQLPTIALVNNIQLVELSITGHYASFFTITRENSDIIIQLNTDLPPQILEENTLITLQLEASYPNAVSGFTTIIIEIPKEPNDVPIFEKAYYVGKYSKDNGLVFESTISLSQGFNQYVSFTLDGDDGQWFTIIENGENNITLHLNSTGIETLDKSHLVFSIVASKPGTLTGSAAIVISLTDVFTDNPIRFLQDYYFGSIEGSYLTLDTMSLEGYTDDVTVSITGDNANYFQLTNQNGVFTLDLLNELPNDVIRDNNVLIIILEAQSQNTRTHAAIILEIIKPSEEINFVTLQFEEPYYIGSYNTATGFVFDSPIILLEGYDEDVQFVLQGANSQWFSLIQNQNSVSLTLSSALPDAVLEVNQKLVFTVAAVREGSIPANAVIIIALTDNLTDQSATLGFDRINYIGSLENNVATLQTISLVGDNLEDVTFNLIGELSSYFAVTADGPDVSVSLETVIPESLLPTNRIILLELQASLPQTNSAYATIVFEVVIEDAPSPVQLRFDEVYYIGSYSSEDGLLFNTSITLAEGYDGEVQFSLEGANSQWFSLIQNQNSVSLTLSSAIPDAVLEVNQKLVFTVAAVREGSITANAVIIIALTDSLTDQSATLGFDRINYIGSLENNVATLQPISLVGDILEDVTLNLIGELSSYFAVTADGPDVSISLETVIPESVLPTNRIILLELQASSPQTNSAYATIVFEVVIEDALSPVQLRFDEVYYIGSYSSEDGLLFNTSIALAEGYDGEVQFSLEGENSQWFNLVQEANSLSLTSLTDIPSTVLENNRKLVFSIKAQRAESISAWATIIISITDPTSPDVSFEKVLYEGVIQFDQVQHELIRILGYSGTDVEIHGEYSSLFTANVVNGLVTVHALGSLNLLSDVATVVLELHISGARSVLLLNVLHSDIPIQPSVSFSSSTYIVSVDITQTGLVGQVHATADNGEGINYSLLLDSVHLQSRVSINNEGELHLSAPVNSGVFIFKAIATTIISQATANATIHLAVEAITVCGADEFVMPPLIILDRDEEEPHRNLITLNSTNYPDCQFLLTNRWPIDQTWLYVDEDGLHTTSIDREHESIAFMALSQIKVELVLSCEGDNSIRTKRSDRTDWLGDYDYGYNKWILAETIPFNSRRSVVNLIVNDINDNAPIFIGKEDEPIAVGYPTYELEDSVLPRSLAELQATDADIGENAAILYWSPESALAVAPATGFVHVRSGARLYDNQRLEVRATDRNGEGLTGSIQLLVKLLDNSHIAVVTVKDAFLDNEGTILAGLRDAIGYDVRALRSVVVSDDINEEDVSRKKRETDTARASLRLYVYGLIEKEPVGVDRLKVDIINNAISTINVISTISLEDHLEGCEICVIPGRDTGLLVATIVLSVLLFIIILLIAIWFFLRWRSNKNYDQFSDNNSLASRNNSSGQLPKPESFPKPRLNIQDLKKSERKLQDMLNTPMEAISVEPSASRKVSEVPIESILDLPLPESQGPIVIQSIDKLKDAADDSDDEFGEVNGTRRKSVVTFNENVEKIIHVEDDPEETDNESNGYEIFKL